LNMMKNWLPSEPGWPVFAVESTPGASCFALALISVVEAVAGDRPCRRRAGRRPAHEALHDAVELGAVVEAEPRQVDVVRDVERAQVWLQLDQHLALVRDHARVIALRRVELHQRRHLELGLPVRVLLVRGVLRDLRVDRLDRGIHGRVRGRAGLGSRLRSRLLRGVGGRRRGGSGLVLGERGTGGERQRERCGHDDGSTNSHPSLLL
jgi:hypothetical protein